MSQLIDFTPSGMYCPIADLYIDPWRPVDRAIVTHAHQDHARIGNRSYMAHKQSVPLLKHTLGEYIDVQAMEYGETIYENGVKISLHPAGHIVGSAQVRLEYKGEVWVVSGDFKMTNDGLSTPFEPLKCNVFVTDAAFGLPIFKWRAQEDVFDEINQWWQNNQRFGITSILVGYTIGKTQRVLSNIDTNIGNVYTHGTIESINKIMRKQGLAIPHVKQTELNRDKMEKGSLVLASPSILHSANLTKMEPYSIALASGWMTLRGSRRLRGIDQGFILSDHADWDQLQRSVRECGAQKIYLTSSGYSSAFYRWLEDNGFDVTEVDTKFTGELREIDDAMGISPNGL